MSEPDIEREAIQAEGAKVVPIRPSVVPVEDWRDALVYRWAGRERVIEHVPANAITIFGHDAAWAGCLAWDDFSQALMSPKAPPWHPDDAPSDLENGMLWDEDDGIRAQAWLARKYSLRLSPAQSFEAAKIVGLKKKVCPPLDWVKSLVWDGVPRCELWLSKYLGAGDTKYARLVGRCYLTALVKRLLVPGCKFDNVVILEGPQGTKKSQSLEALVGRKWFSDTPIDWHSKDRFLSIQGKWLIELAELDGMQRADVGRVKSFVTSPVDRFRPPYGRGNIEVPRRCVLAGSVNPPELGYLRDETGNRRFWPVRCGKIDLEAILRDREQLLAEAYLWAVGGHRYWPETTEEKALCESEQADRLAPDAWEDAIADHLDNQPPGTTVTTNRILRVVIGLDLKDHKPQELTRVGICLRRAGWAVDGRARSGGTRGRVYRRQSEIEAAEAAESQERG